ncbi:hypothetical protein EAE96_008297 [Botrytis aclada]|nr:hypothetical protein EAE96_008297 [Botrytis aclada]
MATLSENSIGESQTLTPNHQEVEKAHSVEDEVKTQFISGWRLYIITFGLLLGVYLNHVEITILSTSTLAIANDLEGFTQTGWILSGYLITYTGFIVIWSKLSDVLGRKTCILATLGIFVVFSGGCGAAQNITQLIICRVFQGIGAAGGFSLTMTFCYEMIPKHQYPPFQALTAVVASLAALTGPILGGIITDKTTWRWVFLLNVPAGVVAFVILFLAIPNGFPNHTANSNPFRHGSPGKKMSAKSFERLDYVGAALLLGASLLLVTGLLEGGVEFAWGSGASISILVISGALWIVFLFWERIVTKDTWKQEPVFPWRFIFNRPWIGVLLASLLNGIPFYTMIFTLPQRIQNTNNMSPLQAAIRIMPLSVGSATGGISGSIITGTGRIPPIYIMWFYSIVTAIGLGLLTTLPTGVEITSTLYGFEFLAGFGLGGTFSIPMLIIPWVVEARDLSTASGAYYEFRIMGGAIGLAIATSIFNNYIRNHLRDVLPPDTLELLLQSTFIIDGFPPELKAHIARVLAEGYNLQMKVTTGFAVAQTFTLALLWKRKQITVVEKKA